MKQQLRKLTLLSLLLALGSLLVWANYSDTGSTITWDFAEFTTQVNLIPSKDGDGHSPYIYEGLTLVGSSSANSKNEASEYVSASAGFHCNGNSSASIRHIIYTPEYDGTLTVSFRSNNATATDRWVGIGTSVVTNATIPTGNSSLLAAEYCDGSTIKTVSANLTAGTQYYVFFGNGGQSITKLEYAYTTPNIPDTPDTPVISEIEDRAPAFPGAEGHGRYVTGGRGGKIIHVTSLNDSVPGSFREAVKGNNPKTIVFDVAGVIALKADLRIGNNTTILGQTAPSPGITLRYYTVQPGANNIVRFIRIRRGEEKDVNDGADATWQRRLTGIILDHCSFSWSIDEIASFYDNNNFTMQWCTVGEALANPGHAKGEHSYGGIWGGKLASFHHNFLLHMQNRVPRFNGARYGWTGYTDNQEYNTYKWQNTVQAENVDFRNCVMYNWGKGNGCYGGPGGGQINIVNNYYKAGPGTVNKTRVTEISVSASDNSSSDHPEFYGYTSRYYINGNYVTAATSNKESYDWSGVSYDSGVKTINGENYTPDPNNYYDASAPSKTVDDKRYVRIKMDAPCPTGTVTTHAASTAFQKVLDYAGASLHRDEVDARYANEAKNGTTTYKGAEVNRAGIIDKVADCNGYTEANFPSASRPAGFDTDDDGIPDAWETLYGLNPNDPADALLKTLDTEKGWYTNLEVYANSLVEDIMKAGNADAQTAVNEYYPVLTSNNGGNNEDNSADDGLEDYVFTWSTGDGTTVTSGSTYIRTSQVNPAFSIASNGNVSSDSRFKFNEEKTYQLNIPADAVVEKVVFVGCCENYYNNPEGSYLTTIFTVASEGASVSTTIGGASFQYLTTAQDVTATFTNHQAGTPVTFIASGGKQLAMNSIEIYYRQPKQPVVKRLFNFVVGHDGNMDDAIAAANADKSAGRYLIFVPNGHHNLVGNQGNGMSWITRTNVSIIGESQDGTFIENKSTEAGISITSTIEFRSGSNENYMQDLSIRNNYEYGGAGGTYGVAVAYYDRGQKNVLKNVSLLSNQDTYTSAGSKGYFENCTIAGTVDFICGSGDYYFDRCDIVINNRSGNVIVAPSTNATEQWGYVFESCIVKRANGASLVTDKSYSLGRPWKESPAATFLNTTFQVLPKDAGWTNMSDGLVCRFHEYGSKNASGLTLSLSDRSISACKAASGSHNPVLKATEAANYTLKNVLGYDPRKLTAQVSAPAGLTISGSTLSWQDDPDALCYVIFRNGEYYANVTETSLTIQTGGNVTWSVRAANAMGGLGEASTIVSEGSITTEKTPVPVPSATAGRTSVHDPSIFLDPNSDVNDPTYYIYGSHLAAAVTKESLNYARWTKFGGEETAASNLFAHATDGQICGFADAYSTHVIRQVKNCNGQMVNFGNFDAHQWQYTGSTVAGNQWAPDIIWNPKMQKYLMYMSINGDKWGSVIVCLTADEAQGPWIYQGPVVFSGFQGTYDHVGYGKADDYKHTDLEIALGQLSALPERYAKGGSWGEYWPNCIDPCVFYDHNGKLWMSYGSWSGGIFMLELDQQTGLRDYTVKYETKFSLGSTDYRDCIEDPYFGRKIAGGWYVSGEASYIQRIGQYYYLFMSYGDFAERGGYQMRVFRSENPDGPYKDCLTSGGIPAIYNRYIMNYDNARGETAKRDEGVRLMGGYRWPSMSQGEIAQGHNSVIVDHKGRALLVYHTRFDQGTEFHEVRVHELFQNQDGWLVASPYEFSGEPVIDNAHTQSFTAEDVAGEYLLMAHPYRQDNANLHVETPVNIVLEADGTVTGAYTGSWQQVSGTNYINVTLTGAATNQDAVTFKGVLTRQLIDGQGMRTLCFTAISNASGEATSAGKALQTRGLCIWGSKVVNIPTDYPECGPEDLSNGWWQAFSDNYQLNEGEARRFVFRNYSSRQENWYNWILYGCQDRQGSQTTNEYFGVRADNCSITGVGTLTSAYDWSTFKEDMHGSLVDMTCSYVDGTFTMTATITTTAGKVLPYGYTTDIPGKPASMKLFFTTERARITGEGLEPQTYYPEVGATDFSTPFRGAFSEPCSLAKGGTVCFDFYNYSSCENNWNNWVLYGCQSASANSTTGEYFAIRNDNWELVDAGNTYCTSNFDWATFKAEMNGSHVEMTCRYDVTGKFTMEAVITTMAGRRYDYSYVKTLANAPETLTLLFTVDKSYISQTLDLTQVTAFARTTPVVARHAAYRRNSANVWGTLCLPFAVRSDERVKFYELEAFETESIKLRAVDEVEAGVPVIYCIQAASGPYVLNLNVDDAVIVGAPVATAAVDGMSIRGIFQDVELDANQQAGYLYYIAKNKFWLSTGTVSVAAFRAVLDYSGSGMIPARIIIDEDGIESIYSIHQDRSESFIIDLQGRQAKGQKGLLVKDGKVMMVK